MSMQETVTCFMPVNTIVVFQSLLSPAVCTCSIPLMVLKHPVCHILAVSLFLWSPQNSEVRGHFQEFLSLNGHQLEQRPFPDVVQLALSQPDSSEVYRQALLQAQERATRGGLYLDWMSVVGPYTLLMCL